MWVSVSKLQRTLTTPFKKIQHSEIFYVIEGLLNERGDRSQDLMQVTEGIHSFGKKCLPY